MLVEENAKYSQFYSSKFQRKFERAKSAHPSYMILDEFYEYRVFNDS